MRAIPLPREGSTPPSGPSARIGRHLLTATRAPVFCVLTLAGAVVLAAPPLLALAVWAASRTPSNDTDHVHNWLWLELVLAPLVLLGARLLAALTRRLTGRWCGVPIADPYRSAPDAAEGGRRPRRRPLADPATWRDLLWTLLSSTGLLVLTALAGLAALLVPGLPAAHRPGPGLPDPGTLRGLFADALLTPLPSPLPPLSPAGSLLSLLPASVLVGLLVGPRLLTAYAAAARLLLGPTRQAELSLRVRHLSETRSSTIDIGAAELRRIERDLHDGAQARLVAMGMTISTADQLIDTNPAAARALLAEAMGASAKALAELRDLIRGIHPPVLADRGLADAVHALTLDLPLRIHFSGELAGRPPAPVESAAYFAVSELLANASKHAGAAQAWVDISHTGGMLRIGVGDDGKGGADPARGSGLLGLERRLAAFDGVMAVSSPPGGPTLVNLEIPCALS